jgi:hypothetical protein
MVNAAIPQPIDNVIKKVTHAIENKNLLKLSEFVHPLKGVRFSQFGYINQEEDLVFKPEEIKTFLMDKKEYKWGVKSGSGDDLILTPKEYFDKYIFFGSFSKANRKSFNKAVDEMGLDQSQSNIYINSVFVDYYFAGTTKNSNFDWKAIRFIFEEYQNKWFVVGMVYTHWTP